MILVSVAEDENMYVHSGYKLLSVLFRCNYSDCEFCVAGSLMGRPLGCCGAASSGRTAVSKKHSNFGTFDSQKA